MRTCDVRERMPSAFSTSGMCLARSRYWKHCALQASITMARPTSAVYSGAAARRRTSVRGCVDTQSVSAICPADDLRFGASLCRAGHGHRLIAQSTLFAAAYVSHKSGFTEVVQSRPNPIEAASTCVDTCVNLETALQQQIVAANQSARIWFKFSLSGMHVAETRSHKQ